MSYRKTSRGAVALAMVALVLALLLPGCAASVPRSSEWSLEVVRANALRGGGGSRCAPGGGPCRSLRTGERLAAPAEIDTAPASSLTLRLGGGALLGLGERTKVRLEREPLRALELRTGRLTLRVLAAPREPTGAERPVLRLGGHTVLVPTGDPVTLAASAEGPTSAAVTVLRGQVFVMSRARPPELLRVGQSARLTPEAAPRAGAAYRGEMAAVEPVASAWLTVPGAGQSGAAALASGSRGIGRLTARVPGTKREISGVRLVDHHVDVVIRDGLARTQVEEEFHNDTQQVLEGRYLFALPPGASVSRLALWVGDELVEGELLERDRAARIFETIVDDSVRPRDPALLEQRGASTISLRIFPIMPGHGRRVLLAYNQALEVEGGWVRYRYPLPLGAPPDGRIARFAVSLRADEPTASIDQVRVPTYPAAVHSERRGLSAHASLQDLLPMGDFVLAYHLADPRPPPAAAAEVHAAVYRGGGWGFGRAPQQELERSRGADRSAFVAFRLPVQLPADAPVPGPAGGQRVFVLDASHSQGPGALAMERALVGGLLGRMLPHERFAVLVCDTDCRGYPERGLLPATAPFVGQAMSWLETARAAGATDLGGALQQGAARLAEVEGGQLVYLGDGAPTAGEQSIERIAAQALRRAADARVDLRLVGLGRSVDRATLAAIAARAGGSSLALLVGLPRAATIEALALRLRAPVVRRPTLELPAGLVAVEPEALPNLRLGAALTVVAKATQPVAGKAVLRGTLDGRPYLRSYALPAPAPSAVDNPLLPRLWAQRRIAALDRVGDPAAAREAVALSREHHVLSRHTALLVLENERMFAAYGIARTQRRAGHGAPRPWGGVGASESASRRGSGGLGLRGVGEGGGARDEASGLGITGLIGASPDRRAAAGGVARFGRSPEPATGTGEGFGSGHGRLGGSHRARPPRVRMGATNVSGRLPPEIIQRIVRQSFGRFRYCYELGLRRVPGLAGRVVVRFIIGRDGHVSGTSGSGDLPDRAVVRCVANAFLSLIFPAPTGGVVTVSYPIVFTPGDGATPTPAPSRRAEDLGPLVATTPALPLPRPPTVVHRPGDERWRQQGEAKLDRLRAAAEREPTSRAARRELIRGSLLHGRFAQARRQAEQLARDDPDWPAAQALLAEARAATGRWSAAARALSSEVELSPGNATLQRHAARAFEAVGDERRACAHWRAAAALEPRRVESLYQSVRCRARLQAGQGGERELLRATRPRKGSLRGRVEALLGGQAPAFGDTTSRVGWLRARLHCRAKRCPRVVVLTPSGRVVSAVTPSAARAAEGAVALAWRRRGTYRTLLVGELSGGEAELELRADGVVRRLSVGLHATAEPFTVAATEALAPRWY